MQLGIVAIGASLARCKSSDDPAADASSGVGGSGSGSTGTGYNPPNINPPANSNIANVGPLADPDALGLRLPEGFTARIVARAKEPVEGTDYLWHPAADGGATFLAENGDYVYVSNAESYFEGGASALRFDPDGNLLDAYSILTGTQINCAGGPTPWGTWLSCEEYATGQVWECDPFGQEEAIVRPALGVFKHEAATVDPAANVLYLTEDLKTGRFYRFTPDQLLDGRPDLSAGSLEVMRVLSGEEGAVEWLPLTDPSAATGATRLQAPDSTAFDGGEGVWFHEGIVYFTTKGDDRVWAFDTEKQELVILYDDDTADEPLLNGVDNVCVTAGGDVLIAEDGGDMQLVAITGGNLVPLVQVTGQDGSEITGPALDPYRQRLYFSSQRGETGGFLGEHGITYEITGPFFVD